MAAAGALGRSQCAEGLHRVLLRLRPPPSQRVAPRVAHGGQHLDAVRKHALAAARVRSGDGHPSAQAAGPPVGQSAVQRTWRGGPGGLADSARGRAQCRGVQVAWPARWRCALGAVPSPLPRRPGGVPHSVPSRQQRIAWGSMRVLPPCRLPGRERSGDPTEVPGVPKRASLPPRRNPGGNGGMVDTPCPVRLWRRASGLPHAGVVHGPAIAIAGPAPMRLQDVSSHGAPRLADITGPRQKVTVFASVSGSEVPLQPSTVAADTRLPCFGTTVAPSARVSCRVAIPRAPCGAGRAQA
jgi:hypothetical protein